MWKWCFMYFVQKSVCVPTKNEIINSFLYIYYIVDLTYYFSLGVSSSNNNVPTYSTNIRFFCPQVMNKFRFILQVFASLSLSHIKFDIHQISEFILSFILIHPLELFIHIVISYQVFFLLLPFI